MKTKTFPKKGNASRVITFRCSCIFPSRISPYANMTFNIQNKQKWKIENKSEATYKFPAQYIHEKIRKDYA